MKKIILACAIMLGVATAVSAENYMNVYGGYSGTSMTAKDADTSTLNGFEIGYTYGLGLGEESPMAIEFGANLGYMSYKEDGATWKQFNVKIPVNFTYKFNLGETFAIAPYAGINFRFNPLHELSYDGESSSEGFKKFQMGWQAGAKIYIKKFFVYGQYGTDFMPAYKADGFKCNSNNFSVGVGYRF